MEKISKSELKTLVKEAVKAKLGSQKKEEPADPTQKALGNSAAKPMKETVKISKSQLKEFVSKAVKKQLAEASSEKENMVEAAKFAMDFDSLVEETLEKVNALIEKGEDSIKDDPLKSYNVQEENQAIISRVGVLKELKGRLVAMLEVAKRKM